jgi:hypothetical protein
MATKTLENLILNFGLIGGIFALSKIFEWLHVWVVVKELQREKKLEKTISVLFSLISNFHLWCLGRKYRQQQGLLQNWSAFQKVGECGHYLSKMW